ncbi:gamma-glutamylcyclotransferase family protein [Halorussus sp. MSC15.2]|uniref:gamma-glutamylcyclotransferase family protein n=1 Tax=Halorussus sp. MSC15.2 TaxID=2283638 RepID=UPI0013D2C69A|nr:gamma-glutamylcyclotransferase family protein [Halorussus sp. MSC15.2]NEU56076.1 gamma-glutamylcyclotransferase [Halorussus sp. MSC15.2]
MDADQSTERDFSDVGIIVYGSLLYPDEWDDLPHPSYERGIRVRVRGYKRILNNEADFRSYTGMRRAVLNVVPDPDAWINGILVPRLYDDEKGELIDRESGYTMEEVDSDDIEFYDSAREDALSVPVKIAVGEKQRDDILPIPGYLKICLKGARYWGTDFYDDFVHSTEVATGETLERYLQEWGNGKESPEYVHGNENER